MLGKFFLGKFFFYTWAIPWYTGPDRIRRPQRPSDQTILLYTILWSDARGCCIDMEEFTNVTGGKGWCWILRPTANEPTTTVTTVTSSRILCIENYVYVQVLRKFTGKQTWSNLKLLPRVLVSHLRASQSTRYFILFCRILTPFLSRSHECMNESGFSCGCGPSILILLHSSNKEITTMIQNPVNKFGPYIFYDSDGCDYRRKVH